MNWPRLIGLLMITVSLSFMLGVHNYWIMGLHSLEWGFPGAEFLFFAVPIIGAFVASIDKVQKVELRPVVPGKPED